MKLRNETMQNLFTGILLVKSKEEGEDS